MVRVGLGRKRRHYSSLPRDRVHSIGRRSYGSRPIVARNELNDGLTDLDSLPLTRAAASILAKEKEMKLRLEYQLLDLVQHDMKSLHYFSLLQFLLEW